MTLFVREAVEGDLTALAELGSEVFWDSYGGTAPDEDIAAHVDAFFSARAVEEEFGRPTIKYFVATDGRNMAGLIKTREGAVPDLIDAPSALEVQQLYVSVDFQRRGVGALLMDSAMAEAQRREIAGVWLSVWTEADWATGFYLKYGFTSRGEIAFMLANQEYTDYLMWKPVGG